ncbi:cytochrome c oxidase subunit 6C [Pectinophora gossypiella]|uniref:cytochrome c oxidase subunit 6C n=1 Tax=Pectinophora gossypiella TaxID=13191 RepID=UPI00214DF385|nr:cytochrome c oxidase subunit 6C [Pectinophora gossypiella]
MAGDKAVSVANKPQMRGLLNAAIKRNLILSLTFAGISGFAFQQLVGAARKKRYAEFYRTYDAEKEFEEMKKKGLFQSC